MRKAGIVSENDDGTKKIKLYRDEEGNVKGDGRCTYLRVESVNLAMQLLDDSEIKPGFPVKIERVCQSTGQPGRRGEGGGCCACP
jgi:hypothetical protein